MKWTTTPPAATRMPGDPIIMAEDVVAQLEAAGRTLMRLPPSGWSTAARTFWPAVLDRPEEAYGWTEEVVRMSRPSAGEITAMDAAFAWLTHIPHDRYVVRRIVAARALVNPRTDRHVFTWRKIGVILGCHHMAAQRWHAEGVRIIVASLNRPRAAA